MFVLDSHCDTSTMMMRGRDIGKNNSRGHVDLPKLKAGGVDASFFALYTSPDLAPDASTRHALEMIGAIYDQVGANPDLAAIATSPEEALENKDKGLVSIFIGMENGAPIQRSLPLLRVFHRLGVRYLTLTHNADNEIADSAAQGTRWHGLSPFGREVVAEMNRLGMIIDIAHASDETFYDVLRCSKSPIVSTHSCCRALAHHRRNLSDEMLKSLADNGGVIQINFYPLFLSDSFAKTLADSGLESKSWTEQDWISDPLNPEKAAAWNAVQDDLAALPRPSYRDVVDHIDHAVKVAGIAHVGYIDGSTGDVPFSELDFDLPQCEQGALKATALPRGDVESVFIKLLQIDSQQGKWHSTGEPAEAPEREPLSMSEKAMIERATVRKSFILTAESPAAGRNSIMDGGCVHADASTSGGKVATGANATRTSSRTCRTKNPYAIRPTYGLRTYTTGPIHLLPEGRVPKT